MNTLRLSNYFDTAKVDVDPKDQFGWTPFLYAAWRGHEAAVVVLHATDKVNIGSRMIGIERLFPGPGS
jgi:ankyrin repeat protein